MLFLIFHVYINFIGLFLFIFLNVFIFIAWLHFIDLIRDLIVVLGSWLPGLFTAANWQKQLIDISTTAIELWF